MSEVASVPVRPAPTPAEPQVLVLDLSRSMLAPIPDGTGGDRQKIEVARSAVRRILQHAASSGSRFGMVTFNDAPRIAVPLGEIRPVNLPYVESLVTVLTPSGRSAIWDAVAMAADLLRSMDGAVHGSIVLVTDGWDNASRRYEPTAVEGSPSASGRADLFGHLLPSGSTVSLRVIGIGNGTQRDKGVDSDRMTHFLNRLGSHALLVGAPRAFTYEEVDTSAELYAQMVHAFIDVDETEAPNGEAVHPDVLAENAARAARALKQPQDHTAMGRIALAPAADEGAPPAEPETNPMDVDVVPVSAGGLARDRYGPLAYVVESYLARDFARASVELRRAQAAVPAVTFEYWRAKIAFARGELVEAARALLAAWNAAETIPASSRVRVTRRLALFQAQMQKDEETAGLLRFIEETEARIHAAPEPLQAQVMQLFDELIALRETYQLTRLQGGDDAAGAAQSHEEAVADIFGHLQDVRLDNVGRDPAVEGALDFIEICLAEMR